MNIAKPPVQWLFLDLNAFLASCEQQEAPALRGKPIIVVQTLTDSSVAIAASYTAKAHGIKIGTLVREARRLCPDVIPVQANHRLYTEYHERIFRRRQLRTGRRCHGLALRRARRGWRYLRRRLG
jgi:DNA polymerase-4